MPSITRMLAGKSAFGVPAKPSVAQVPTSILGRPRLSVGRCSFYAILSASRSAAKGALADRLFTRFFRAVFRVKSALSHHRIARGLALARKIQRGMQAAALPPLQGARND